MLCSPPPPQQCISWNIQQFFFSSTHFVFSFGRKSGVYSCLYILTEPNHTFARSGKINIIQHRRWHWFGRWAVAARSSAGCRARSASNHALPRLGVPSFFDFATCDLFRWCVLSLLRLTPPLLSTEIWPNAWRVPCFQMNIPGFSLPWGGFLGSCWQATAGWGGSTTTEMFTSSLKADS